MAIHNAIIINVILFIVIQFSYLSPNKVAIIAIMLLSYRATLFDHIINLVPAPAYAVITLLFGVYFLMTSPVGIPGSTVTRIARLFLCSVQSLRCGYYFVVSI